MSTPRWDRLAEAYRQEVDEPLTDERARQQRERLARDFAREMLQGEPSPARGRWWVWGISSALAASAALMLIIWWIPGAPPPLECHTADGRPVKEGQRLGGDDAVQMHFADGTRVDLDPGSTLRAERLADKEVQLHLEHGRIEARVKKSDRRAWRCRAGPYQVRVRGTMFSVDWEAQKQRLSVQVTRGTVNVGGGEVADQRLSAGEGVEVEAGKVRLLGKEPAPASPEPASDSGLGADGAVPSATPAPGPPSTSRALPSRWRALLLKGHHEAAWREARRVGIRRLQTKGRAAELMLLADLARLRRHPEVAQRTLTTLRRRFRGKPRAALAAFELGRLAATRRNHTAAVRYFGVYLKEQPRGSRAADALGRQMAALKALGKHAQARHKARAYLEAHPRGTYADLARTILEGAR